MARTMLRATLQRTKTTSFTADFANALPPISQSQWTDAQIVAAASTPGHPAANGELMAASPGAAGTITITPWTITGSKVAIEEYAAWTPSVTHSKGKRISPTILSNRLYFVTTGGTSGDREPTWPSTIGASVTATNGTAVYMVIDKFQSTLTYATNTAYTKGQIVRPAAYPNQEYVVIVAGSTDGTTPSWSASPTIGTTQYIVNNGVTFLCMSAG